MNSQLYDKKYPIPIPIIKNLESKIMIGDSTGEGVKRAKFLIKNGYATYQMLKRIKNFFDNFDQTSDSLQEFELSGGEDMRNYIEHTLEADRGNINRSSEIKRAIQPDMNRGMKAYVGESTMKIKTLIKEAEEKEEATGLTLNAVVVVLNPEKRFLLLKRSSYPDQWMPNKWSMPGGGIEEGEEPSKAAIRELKEETGLVVTKFKESFVIQRDENVEHVFLSLYEGDPFNIKLDKENQGFGWFGYNEIKHLDTVPNLIDYINITVKDYE